MMMSHCGCHRMCYGVMLLVLGVLFMLGTTMVWPEFTFGKYWPLFLILAGLHKLFCKCGENCSMGKK